MKAIIGTAANPSSYSIQRFMEMPVRELKLSTLESFFSNRDERVLHFLAASDGCRRTIAIDQKFLLKSNSGKILMDTSLCTIDYHLTVANCIGFSPLLPNMASNHLFSFKMDLHKPFKEFRGKHAMLGFDPAGCMLYIGQCNNEDVFLAMAPNTFLDGYLPPLPAGSSSGTSTMSPRHYRQTIMMLVYFLAKIGTRSFHIAGDGRGVYHQDLDSATADFFKITDALNDDYLYLNFEEVKLLDEVLVSGYDAWVDGADRSWKADGFLENNSPIVVTSRFGQDARIALRGNEDEEANCWQLERDYSKLAFLTVAIATSIQYVPHPFLCHLLLGPFHLLYRVSLSFRTGAKRFMNCDPFPYTS